MAQWEHKEFAGELQKKKKNDPIEVFIKCRDECNSQQKRCAGLGFKQCSVCKNVLCSICTKVMCKSDGAQPIMILPAKHYNKISKQLFMEKDDVNSDGICSDDEMMTMMMMMMMMMMMKYVAIHLMEMIKKKKLEMELKATC